MRAIILLCLSLLIYPTLNAKSDDPGILGGKVYDLEGLYYSEKYKTYEKIAAIANVHLMIGRGDSKNKFISINNRNICLFDYYESKYFSYTYEEWDISWKPKYEFIILWTQSSNAEEHCPMNTQFKPELVVILNETGWVSNYYSEIIYFKNVNYNSIPKIVDAPFTYKRGMYLKRVK